MAAKLPVWGIDVGQCSLKAMKLQQAGDGVELLDVDIVEHDGILSQAEAEAPQMIRKALTTFISRKDLRKCLIVVAVPGQQTLTRFTKMPPVEQKKLPDMIKYEAGQQIPFDMDEVVWDYQIFAGEDSPDVEVGIFAIRKELIRNHLSQFTELGIEPVIVQTSPMASYNAARFEWGVEPGKAAILLDMGALATDLIIFEGNRIWSRPVPIGGNRFTEALVSAFKISFSKAEKLKRTAATSKYARQVFQAMRPVFADLVSEVQRSIGFYTSTHRDTHITRVVGMGNAFQLPGLQKFLQQNLQLEVEKISGFKKLNTSAASLPPEYAQQVMSFGVAYGLALQGLGLAAVDASLLPLDVSRRLAWRKKTAWFGAAAACLAVAAGSLWVGNVLAQGQLNAAFGANPDLRPPAFSSAADAMRALDAAGAGGPPLQYAASMLGAAEKLKQEFSSVSAAAGFNREDLKRLAKLPEKNILVPRIIDVIQEAFEAAMPEEIRNAKNVRDYQRIAKQKPRSERREVWVERVEMQYHPVNPALLWSDGASGDKGAGKAGWGIQITGLTTASDIEAPKLLEEQLIATLDKLGKRPGRGFYFGKVTLFKVTQRPIGTKSGGEGGGFGPGGGQGDSGRRGGGGRRGTRGEGPSISGPGTPPGGAGGMGGYGRGSGGGVENTELGQWEQKFNTTDPLTGEKIDGDQQFVIHILAYSGNTPEKEIPEEYKTQTDSAKTEPGKDGGDAERTARD